MLPSKNDNYSWYAKFEEFSKYSSRISGFSRKPETITSTSYRTKFGTHRPVTTQLDLEDTTMQGSQGDPPINEAGQIVTRSRVYADANGNMPQSYWDYDNLEVEWGSQENYEIIRKIG
ncbi:Casein kinase II subunit alpha, partial [Coemansia sp. RSA 486]